MEKAVFNLENYCFSDIQLHLANLEEETTLSLNFEPQGVFDTEKKQFTLVLIFQAIAEKSQRTIVDVKCEADFVFKDPISFEDIPSYFYPNSIAIVFPYIRAMVSTITLQANIQRPIVIPTMNLSSLQEQLRNRVEIQ